MEEKPVKNRRWSLVLAMVTLAAPYASLDGIRPEHLDLAASGIGAEVVVVEPMGARTELLVKVQDQALTVMANGRSAAQPGSRVHLAPRPQQADLLDAASGARL